MGRRAVHRGLARILSALAIALGLVTPGEARAAGGAAAVVQITDRLVFEPVQVTIAVGETVRWKSVSVLVHTVTADPAKAIFPESAALPDAAAPFDSGNIEPGGTFEHRFTVPGTYRYFCIPHEGTKMVGMVTVEPAAAHASGLRVPDGEKPALDTGGSGPEPAPTEIDSSREP